MAENDRCPSCGAMVLPQENFCPQCGAPLKAGQTPPRIDVPQASDGRTAPEANASWQPGTVPHTIGQLRAFCDYNGMPLEKMRFFVGEDYRQPRAFGIYREGDQFVVYKNKADGSRAVRYHGPDEAHAVGELYAKLLDECHKRDIWPDGKPEGLEQRRKKSRRRVILIAVVMALIFGAVAVLAIISERHAHANDGYYDFHDSGMYYRYGTDWYYYDDTYDWIALDDAPYGDYDDYGEYYMGDDYDAGWGYSDFERSDAWASIQEERHTSSSDYSDWDSGGTDWDSDW